MGGANCESHAARIRGCEHVGVQSRSVAEVEFEVRKAQERPHTDANRIDTGNHSMTHGCGLDPLTDRALEHRFHQHQGQGCDQRRGDRSSKPPPSSAGSKRSHRSRMPQSLYETNRDHVSMASLLSMTGHFALDRRQALQGNAGACR